MGTNVVGSGKAAIDVSVVALRYCLYADRQIETLYRELLRAVHV